ncbi:hypothetical protein H0H87_003141, partial [Tephrocybe sp. NHM501043]
EHFKKILGHDPEKEEREKRERIKEEKNKNRNTWKEGDETNKNKNENEVEVNKKVEAKTVPKLSSPLCGLCIHIPFLDDKPEPGSLASQNAIQSLLAWLSQLIIFDETSHVFDAVYKKWMAKNKPALVYIAKGLNCVLPPQQVKKALNRKHYAHTIVSWLCLL